MGADQPAAAVPAATPARHAAAAPAGTQPGCPPRGPAPCAIGPAADPGAAAAPGADGKKDQALTGAAPVSARREPVRTRDRETGRGRAVPTPRP